MGFVVHDLKHGGMAYVVYGKLEAINQGQVGTKDSGQNPFILGTLPRFMILFHMQYVYVST